LITCDANENVVSLHLSDCAVVDGSEQDGVQSIETTSSIDEDNVSVSLFNVVLTGRW
jgi:hypothetical protein